MLQKHLYKIIDICETCSLGRSHVYELIAKGELQTVKIGRSCRIPHSSFEAFLRKYGVELNNSTTEGGAR